MEKQDTAIFPGPVAIRHNLTRNITNSGSSHPKSIASSKDSEGAKRVTNVNILEVDGGSNNETK